MGVLLELGGGGGGVLVGGGGGGGASLVRLSTAAKCVFVVVESSTGTVVRCVTLGKVAVSPACVPPTIGSQAPGPMVRPSCSTTVERPLR